MSSTMSNAHLWQHYYTISEARAALSATHGQAISANSVYNAANYGQIATVRDQRGMMLFLKSDVDQHRVSTQATPR